MDKKKQPKKSKYVATVINFLTIILASGILVGCEPVEKDYKLTAYCMSQLFVKDKLLAPSSAEFPYYPQRGILVIGNETTGRFKVEAYVDSQNAFGAKVRSRYFCILQYDAKKDDWELKSLTFK